MCGMPPLVYIMAMIPEAALGGGAADYSHVIYSLINSGGHAKKLYIRCECTISLFGLKVLNLTTAVTGRLSANIIQMPDE